MATEMYYRSAGGLPVRSSTAQIRDLLAEGTLTKRTWVWVPGQRDWAPLGDVASKLLTGSHSVRPMAVNIVTRGGLLVLKHCVKVVTDKQTENKLCVFRLAVGTGLVYAFRTQHRLCTVRCRCIQ